MNVNTASSAMVNSVTLTATGIEAMVERINEATNATTNKVMTGYSLASKITVAVITSPIQLINFLILTCVQVIDKINDCVNSVTQFINDFIFGSINSLHANTCNRLVALRSSTLKFGTEKITSLYANINPFITKISKIFVLRNLIKYNSKKVNSVD